MRYFLTIVKTCLVLFFSSKALAGPVGELFLVDHYRSSGTERGSIELYRDWIKNRNLGGIIFWNADKRDFATFQKMTNDYKSAALDAGLNPPLLSIDHEGIGEEGFKVQRLANPEGLTDLTSPRRLGLSMDRYGTRLCELHGDLIAAELQLTGFNAGLSTVSDVYTPGSLTQSMLRERSISKDPEKISACVQAILGSINSSSPYNFVFTTKHFPGLGLVNGNTDTGVRKSTAKNIREEGPNLLPFKEVIDFANRFSPENLGLMISNAEYPVYDSQYPAPESYNIATDLLRNQLGFRGILISDALWVGQYENLKDDDFHVALAKMALAGLDMLMIPAERFGKAYKYFSDFYEGKVSPPHALELIYQFGFRDINELVSVFRRRIDESAERINRVKRGFDRNLVREGLKPSEETESISEEYNSIIGDLKRLGVI